MSKYLYIRKIKIYENYIKFGHTDSPIDRDQTYRTSELIRGDWIGIYEIDPKQLIKINIKKIEYKVKKHFDYLNYKGNGGTEFFENSFSDELENYLNNTNIIYHKLSEEDIDELYRKHREIEDIKKILRMKALIRKLKKYNFHNYFNGTLRVNNITGRPFQNDIIQLIIEYFRNNDKGIIVEPCGVGKTIIALLSVYRLNYNKILIGVPSIELLEQWHKTVKLIFPSSKVLIIDKNVDKNIIANFYRKNPDNHIVISTYHSGRKIIKTTDHVFDIKILDEVHHITSIDFLKSSEKDKRTFIRFLLEIESQKQISLTATLKIKDEEINTDSTITNDNIEHFGNIIDRKNLLWAINRDIVCDYIIQTPVYEDNLENNQLYISALCIYESFRKGESHHSLMFCNIIESVKELYEYIKTLSFSEKYYNIPIYFKKYYSDIKTENRKKIIEEFCYSSFGILIVVGCLGEGWDCKILDSICICENMGSTIRIVQSVLRCCRKNINETSKIGKIIIPVLIEDGEWNNTDAICFETVRNIIYEIGLEDANVCQKIKIFKSESEENRRNIKNNFDPTEELSLDTLKNIYLRIMNTVRRRLGFTYDKAKKEIIRLQQGYEIKNLDDYKILYTKDIRFPEDPKEYYGSKFKGWFDFLSLNGVSLRKYYTLEECKTKCREILKIRPELKMYNLDLLLLSKKLYEIDNRFPPFLWCDYYNVKSLDYIIIFEKNKRINIDLNF